jgi:hypothetical protein
VTNVNENVTDFPAPVIAGLDPAIHGAALSSMVPFAMRGGSPSQIEAPAAAKLSQRRSRDDAAAGLR